MIKNNRSGMILLIAIILTIVNLAAVATVLINIRKTKVIDDHGPLMSENDRDSKANGRGPAFLVKELGFDSEQQKVFRESRNKFRSAARPLFIEIRQLNNEMMEEILKDNPDTLRLQDISLKSGDLQARIKQLTVKHLLDVKAVATPGQQEKLGFFYRELLSRDSGPMGKGMQHQHRHGQRKSNEE